jgi:hypothetical protein
MSRIFLSHSSKDDFAAVGVRDWLNENGWHEVFLDLDPVAGIHPGERWERALHEQAARCEAVLFLVSRHWLDSEWCRREYELAQKLNKRVFIVLIENLAIDDLPFYLRATQAVSLAAGEDHRVRRVTLPATHEERHVTFSSEGLERLKDGLTQAGLDARFFAWPPANEPDRSPYRGLEPLEAADAGIFFGREAPVIEALDALRGLRESACPRLLVILGASGAGKSSFLRAGLLPRLARDDRAFLPLSAIRPERAAVTGANGLVTALAASCAQQNMSTTRAQLRAAALQGAVALCPYLRELSEQAQKVSLAPKLPTLILPIDQAEELFRAEGVNEGDTLLALLRELLVADDPPIIALFAIRSDSYDALEHAKPLEGLSQKAFPLLPMPRGAYQTVIEGPAYRLAQAGRKFEIGPSLTQALLEDLDKGGGSDALPLLAFTLAQLFFDHEAAGRLSREDYERFGGLTGAIDAAMARVFIEADKDARIPRDHAARLALLRRGLIPWLAGIDPETKTPRRRRAPAAQIPEEARPLVDLLVEQRLLTRMVDEATHVITIEPAHEALLRQWGNLKGWLEEDFGRLVTLEGVKRASRDWDANGRDSAWAAHSSARLDEAVRLDNRPDLAALLDTADRAYLAACQQKESELRAKELAFAAAERRAARRTRIGLAVSSVLAVLAIGAAAFGFWQADVARQQSTLAEQRKQDAEAQALKAEQRSAVLATSVSQSFTDEGSLDQAMLLMLDAANVFDDKTAPDEIRIALTKALQKRERIETRTLFPNMQVFETDEALLLFDPATNDIWKFTDSLDPKRLVAGTSSDGPVLKLRESTNGKTYIVLRANLDVELIDTANGQRRKIGTIPAPPKQPGVTYDLSQTKITDDGLIIRDFFMNVDQDKNAPSNYVQLFDTDNGRLIQGPLRGTLWVARKSSAGGAYAVDGDGKLFEITAGGDGLIAAAVKLSGSADISAHYGQCVAGMPAAARTAAIGDLSSIISQSLGEFACRKLGSNYLLTEISYGSAGASRTDLIYLPNGKQIDLRDALAKALSQAPSSNNFSWSSAYPTDQAATPLRKRQLFGILLNRSAYVLGPDSADADATSDLANNLSLLLDYRHATAVEHARFIGPDQLAVVEGEPGRIEVHDFGTNPKQNLFASPLDSIIGEGAPVALLHPGTCVGYSIPHLKDATLPDGRKIVFNTTSVTESGDKHELDISGARNAVVALGADATCVQFSADWKRMLIVRDAGITLYDFQKVLQTGTISGSEIGAISIARPSSAMFADSAGQQIITTDYTNQVFRWRQDAQGKAWLSTEIYRGDNPILSAEPDAAGDRLILLEGIGGGAVHGVFYSISARKVWLDLGSDYKWLGATFTDKSDIVVSEHWKWARVFPMLSLSALAALADKELSPECRPPAPKEYRKSRCWPASYR